MGRLGRYAIALVPLCLLLVVASSLAQTCGKRMVMNFLIVNGTEAKEGHWPWHVAIFHNDGLSFHYACGGTILDHNTVLTAAHCVKTSNGVLALERVLVHVGRNRLRVGSDRVQERKALKLIVYPEYSVNNIEHDIALIKLETDITYTVYIQPICLWNRGEDQNGIVGSWGTVIGFGRDETGNVSDTLREASIPVVSHMTCIESNRQAFAYHLTTNMLCASSRDGIGACNGDSGGGLFFKYDDVWYVRGVVSFTKPVENTAICDTNQYTVFTDVAKYLKWIEPYMRGQLIELRTNNNNDFGLLPMSTCGVNPYTNFEEISQPVPLGYPWVGLLEYNVPGSREKIALCHVILISDLYLITAVDCVKKIPTHLYILYSVRLGEYGKNTKPNCAQVNGQSVCSPPVQTLRIESVITHPDYNKQHYANDIALIRLRDRADTSQSYVKPICLPVTSELRSKKSSHYIVTSWGLGSRGYRLETTQSEIYNFKECRKLYSELDVNITSNQICLRQQDGDCKKMQLLASPLQFSQEVQGKDRYVLYGMLSFGNSRCNSLSPHVFTSVASYMDWILENIQE